ncbi:MAG: lysophospholipid acyltransferase family protein [Planctomycetes bacterium]|nr:lysophospholipid acyltransferase family protein [Planctomycetota bacterium]
MRGRSERRSSAEPLDTSAWQERVGARTYAAPGRSTQYAVVAGVFPPAQDQSTRTLTMGPRTLQDMTTQPDSGTSFPWRKRVKLWIKRQKRRLQYVIAHALALLLRLCPDWLWNGIGRLIIPGLVPARIHGVATRQLEDVLGDRYDETERRAILVRMFRNIWRTMHEMARYRRGKRAFLERMVHAPEGTLERLRQWHAESGGLIMMSPHFGNFELMPSWCVMHGMQGCVVAKRLPNPDVNQMLVDSRARNGVETVYQDENPRKLLRRLLDGQSVGLVPDLDIKRLPGIFVSFFGRDAYTITGPAHLSLLSGKPIVPAFLVWQGGHYEFHLEEPIHPDRDAPRDEEIRRLTRAWSRVFETKIAAYPDHWYWFHERWKTTPEKLEIRREGQRVKRIS